MKPFAGGKPEAGGLKGDEYAPGAGEHRLSRPPAGDAAGGKRGQRRQPPQPPWAEWLLSLPDHPSCSPGQGAAVGRQAAGWQHGPARPAAHRPAGGGRGVRGQGLS